MHVLFVAPQPFYEDRGTPIAIHDTLVALGGLGFKVDLATYPIGSETNLRGVEIFRTVNPLWFSSIPVGLSFRKVLLDIFLLRTVIRLARQNHYDCVHGVEEGAAIGLLCKALFGIPAIYDMQSSIPEQLSKLRWFRTGPGRWLSLLFERWLVRKADCIMASRGLVSHVHSIKPGKAVFECFFDGYFPRPKDEALARSLGTLGHPTIVYTGNFAPYQGLEVLLEVALMVRGEFPDVVFLLVGGTEVGLAHLSRIVKRHRLESTVKLHPRCPRHVIPDFLALADVLILARTRGENAPLKIYDYLKSGKTIVATDIPAHRSILTDETAILARPNARSLAQAIKRALRNPEEAKKIALTAKAFVQNNSLKPLRETVTEAYGLIAKVGRKRNFH